MSNVGLFCENSHGRREHGEMVHQSDMLWNGMHALHRILRGSRLTVDASTLSFPTNFPSRSLTWLHSTSRDPWSSMSTTSSCEILASPGGSFGLEDDDATFIGIIMRDVMRKASKKDGYKPAVGVKLKGRNRTTRRRVVVLYLPVSAPQTPYNLQVLTRHHDLVKFYPSSQTGIPSTQ